MENLFFLLINIIEILNINNKIKEKKKKSNKTGYEIEIKWKQYSFV